MTGTFKARRSSRPSVTFMSKARVLLRPHVSAELEAASAAHSRGDRENAWRHLERAHVLSQPSAWLHTRVRWGMLVLAIRVGDPRELAGQVIRLVVAGIASAVGRFPAGNTGRARVPITKPMPVADDLVAILASVAGNRRGEIAEHFDRDGDRVVSSSIQRS